eukprot:TRINITY_DN62124_c0_g3_i1.p1 TRINITY_DN62124_c0_g3~~TRINITY_DN62124_c0_g3_i1.p1  ORF type:complete len:298 (+),score=4.53 TRINITY_DN62124_c0_g3_i1:80-973(+)
MAILPRFHLFELHDLEWFPNWARILLLEILHFMWVLFDPEAPLNKWVMKMVRKIFPLPPFKRPYMNLVPLLDRIMEETGHTTIIDLCSGAGGPMSHVQQALQNDCGRKDTVVVLTDLYPQTETWYKLNQKNNNLRYSQQSVDATKVPGHLKGIRTLMACFHHFQPKLAQGIIKDAIDNNVPIVIVEGTERSLPVILAYALAAFPLVTIGTPFALRWTLKRFFFTYIIPFSQFLYFFDSIVSCLRSYTPEELHNLVAGIEGSNTYNWEFKRFYPVPFAPIPLCFFVGTPKAGNRAAAE